MENRPRRPALLTAFAVMRTAIFGPPPAGWGTATTAYTYLSRRKGCESARFCCQRFAPMSALAGRSATAFSWPPARRSMRYMSRPKGRTLREAVPIRLRFDQDDLFLTTTDLCQRQCSLAAA